MNTKDDELEVYHEYSISCSDVDVAQMRTDEPYTTVDVHGDDDAPLEEGFLHAYNQRDSPDLS